MPTNNIIYLIMPLKNIDYSKTIIYKIACNDLNVKDVYVGSTIDFNTRKKTHKQKCNANYNERKIYTIINDNGGWDNWCMIKIEDYACNASQDARTRERYYYELLNATLNTVKPISSIEDKVLNRKEWRLKNKDKITQQQKIYQENNSDRVKELSKNYYEKNKESKKIKIMCECCNKLINKSQKTRHEQSQIHMNLLNKKNSLEINNI